MDEVRDKIRRVVRHWDTAIAPAIVQFGIESGRYHPESEDKNGTVLSRYM